MSNLSTRYSANYDEARQGLNFAFLKVLQNIDKYNPQFALATWIRTIFVRHFIDEFRKNQKESLWVTIDRIEQNEIPVISNSAEEVYESKYLDYLLAQLPQSTRIAFTMYVVDEFSYTEIAEILDIAESTCRWHVNSARKKIKEMLTADIEKNKVKAV